MKFVYQIYPLSFKDTNSDGYGDLKGIIEKLPYLKDLGVDYIWLTPIYKSPLNDNGYDVEDYFEINEIFGTKTDLNNLIKEANKLDLKIMLDMVFNHTSTKHIWFQKFLKGDEKYRNYYIWKESKSIPNNWESKFGGPTWTEFAPGKWYLHLFDKTQADLNWENEEVRNELKKIIRYYLNLGVKGFRFDVINLISKSSFASSTSDDGRKMYTNGPKVHTYLKEIAKEFKDEADFLTVGELSSTDIENAQKFANNQNDELNSVFTFHHLKVDYHPSNDKFIYYDANIKALNDIFELWQIKMQETGSTLANFFNNHDQPRSVSRFIKEGYEEVGSKMLFALCACMNGITYIYQGEEIAMTNPQFSQKEMYRDVETLNYFNENNLTTATKGIKQKSRDNSRTPMQWNTKKYSGFSDTLPWINVNSNYLQCNVEEQMLNEQSTLNFYKKFIRFCKADENISNGTIKFNTYRNNIISFTKEQHNKKYLCVFSFTNEQITFNYDGKVIYTNTNVEKNKLNPYQFLIINIQK